MLHTFLIKLIKEFEHIQYHNLSVVFEAGFKKPV